MSEVVGLNVNDWIDTLSDDKMPGFSTTVTDVTQAVNSEHSSAVDVAQAILRDPSLTSRLLKMANSFFYNPNGQEMSTVSRAVMVLGFDQVRALALSLVLVDTLSSGEQRDKLTEEIAQSFHAAVQAEQLARKTKTKSPENIFVATLLSRIGNMAFWAFADEQAPALLQLIKSGHITEQEAEQEALGFSLKELSKGLTKSWSLGELLEQSLSDDNNSDPRVNMIQMGQMVASAAIEGWESEQAQQTLEYVAQQLDLDIGDVTEIAHTNATKAKKITKLYGITKASNKIPQANQPLIDFDPNTADVEVVEAEQISDVVDQEVEQAKALVDAEIESIVHPEPDSDLQLTILSDITEAIAEKPSINIILEMVLEGLYRGVGMDRSLFAILSKDRKSLICKYALGADNEKLCQELTVDISNPKNIFNQIISSKTAVHVPADPKLLGGTLTRNTIELLGTPPYLVMPTIVKGKVIGIYMADRNASKRAIKKEDFVAFQQFCQQANMGLTFLTMQG